jgi:hypothetical protein
MELLQWREAEPASRSPGQNQQPRFAGNGESKKARAP